jgi:hypothetical protein
VQHKSQPSLLINARLLQPILIGKRGFAISNISWHSKAKPSGLLHKPCFSHELTPLHLPKRSATRDGEPTIEFD